MTEFLRREFYAWIADYISDHDEAIGLAGLLAHRATKFAKTMAATGFVLGVLGTILILKWLA